MIVTSTQPNSYQNLDFYKDILSSFGVAPQHVVCSPVSFNVDTFVNTGDALITLKPFASSAFAIPSSISMRSVLFGNFRISSRLSFAVAGSVSLSWYSGVEGVPFTRFIFDYSLFSGPGLFSVREFISLAIPGYIRATVTGAGNAIDLCISFSGVSITY